MSVREWPSVCNTPLMYACAGGHEDVVRTLLDAGANVEDHNENGHTPLMEAASAGHVGVSKILLDHGAGINTHSNEFKESALTLACYKGHLEMVRFLLEAGADQEHKTDEMHTALMEASMDGHVEVARLLLDSGAQVNMPTDSFESPLTLAACGGHVDLAMLLIERGANIEEVNDEGYTPLMEAAREGHEEMVALLLSQGANINAQTEETQETALTLACCGGFTDVADFLIKAGADLELGASTPLMEASQEGHIDLVRYLLESNADVHAQTQTGDTALTYACENGHTDVADLLLQFGANLEHESEGGRTPLMKACRAGHLCTVQFLISKHADVNRQTTNNDHTPLSLACAGGHLAVVELLLAQSADPFHKLKDNSTMLIEAAKGGHTSVVQLLLDYPHSIMMTTPHPQTQGSTGLHEVPDAVRVLPQEDLQVGSSATATTTSSNTATSTAQKTLLRPDRLTADALGENNLTSAEVQQVSLCWKTRGNVLSSTQLPTCRVVKIDGSIQDKGSTQDTTETKGEKVEFQQKRCREEQIMQKQHIFEELQSDCTQLQKLVVDDHLDVVKHLIKHSSEVSRSDNNMGVECDMQLKPTSQQLLQDVPPQLGVLGATGVPGVTVSTATLVPGVQPLGLNIEIASQGMVLNSAMAGALFHQGPNNTISVHNAFYTGKNQTQISLQQQAPPSLQQQAQTLLTLSSATVKDLTPVNIVVGTPVISTVYPPLPPTTQQQQQQTISASADVVQGKLDGSDLSGILSDQSLCQLFPVGGDDALSLEAADKLLERGDTPELDFEEAMEEVAQTLAAANRNELKLSLPSLREQRNAEAYAAGVHDALASMQEDLARVEYIAVPTNGTTPLPAALQVQHAGGLQLQYQQYQLATGLQVAPNGVQLQTGGTLEVAGGIQITGAPGATQILNPRNLGGLQTVTGAPFQPLLLQAPQIATPSEPSSAPAPAQAIAAPTTQYVQPTCSTHQVQVATQTATEKKIISAQTTPSGGGKGKKVRYPVQARQESKAVTPASFPALSPQQQQQQNNYQIDPNTAVTAGVAGVAQFPTGHPCPATQCQQASFSCMDVDSETDSNHDTALTLACAGGHEELVELLLSRGADIEHRDKKGFTPLILAATAGHEKVVEILLNHGADIEAQSERTKDTPLSLACSGGRYEVVELLLTRGANKEHRNVSDYTPLSLAASGGYVNIIKLLLAHGAEINSRTGSKLGISPLMLAAMNGHTAAVKLLLDMGSDINAQIETNRNTALTLACFQGRHEVVSLLLDRKANVEHRAKTGLTPLMEAASGGYVEVGRVLLDKGADVNAPPVPSSRDTALTIAADKGHCRFVELLLSRGAQVEVKNKKGNSPLWLAANGGHLNVVELLYNAHADIDSQDNRKVSCLMAAFRKGHMKVVKWMVNHVTQFPSDQEMTRYISTVSDKELLEKCQECVKIIRVAKDHQAAKANKNATILLEELDMEKTREESKKAAAARRRERKKKKKLEKKEEKRKLHEENKKNEVLYQETEQTGKKSDDEEMERVEESEREGSEARCGNTSPTTVDSPVRSGGDALDKEEGDSGIDANSQGSCSSNDVKSKEKRKDKKKKKSCPVSSCSVVVGNCTTSSSSSKIEDKENLPLVACLPEAATSRSVTVLSKVKEPTLAPPADSNDKPERRIRDLDTPISSSLYSNSQILTSEGGGKSGGNRGLMGLDRKLKGQLVFEASRPQHPAEREDFEATGNETYIPAPKGKKSYMNHYCDDGMSSAISAVGKNSMISSTSPKQGGKREEGWKEVVRKFMNSPFRSKKVSVPLNAISRVIGRGGSNINAIRGTTGAHIEVEKQSKGQGERIITIKGSADATRQAHNLIAALIKDPDLDVQQLLPKPARVTLVSTSAWDKTSNPSKSKSKSCSISQVPMSLLGAGPAALLSKSLATGGPMPLIPTMRSASTSKLGSSFPTPVTRGTAPRLVAQAEKRAAAAAAAHLAAVANTKTTMSYTSAIMTSGRGTTKVVGPSTSQTFAAKLTETVPLTSSTTVLPSSHAKPTRMQVTAQHPSPSTPQVSPPQQHHSTATTTSSSSTVGSPKHVRPLPAASAPPSIPGQYQMTPSKAPFTNSSPALLSAPGRSTTPQQQDSVTQQVVTNTPQEYSLFNDTFTKQSMWGRENENNQKGMNFASVAATGANTGPGQGVSNAKFECVPPPQADAAKAPGYRGTAVCSPVSSKTSSNSTTPPSSYQGSNVYSEPGPGTAIAKPLLQPAVARPVPTGSLEGGVGQPSSSHIDSMTFTGRSVYPQAVGEMQPARSVMVSQASLDLYNSQSSSSGGGGYVPENSTASLLKMVQNNAGNVDTQQGQSQQQQQQQQQMMYHHQHHPLNFSQSQSSAPTNTTVTMSRLNPRAPDFSLHLANKTQQQQQQQQQAPSMFNQAPGYHPRANMMPPSLPSSMSQQQNSNSAIGATFSFPMTKSSLGHYHPQNLPPNSNPAPNNGQRWPLYPQAYHHANHPPDILSYPGNVGTISQLANLANLAQQQPVDLLGIENGAQGGGSNSPVMSPSSPANTNPVGAVGEPSGHKMEDRKIAPIGMERANWKQFNATAGSGAPITDWMLGAGEPKLAAVSSWTGMTHAMDRHQMYPPRPNYGRLPPTDDLPHLMDASFQASHHPDSQHSYHNGSAAAAAALSNSLSLMHHALPLIPHYNMVADMGGPDNMKLEPPPNWDTTRMDVSDKQHGWGAKWSH
uniref:K Homology domain-containing protein n=1 Tax=Timema monikensis TaxID=170555 RepID=A0A7R9E1V1_9NEOP|nr:unnamed protein product [Timema monikensis]